MKDLQRKKELERKNKIVAIFVEIMRYNGASERSIQNALPGFYEFAKFYKKAPGNLVPDKPENP